MLLRLVWLLVLLLVQARAECPQHCKCTRHLHFVTCIEASLTDVPRLSTPTEITILNLSRNNITRLTDGIFQEHNLMNVSAIDLMNNNITTIDGNAFRGLSRHLLDLSVRSNHFLKLPEQGFQLETLIVLDMSSCNLDNIPASFFHGMPDIVYLYLTNNKLALFDPVIIEPGKGLQLDRLFLDENKFTQLDMKLVLYQKTEFVIDGNPFHCDCAFQRAYSALAEREASSYSAQITCRTPAYLEGVTGDHLLKMRLKCENEELVPSLDDRSWWLLHQWWILTLCALAVVVLAVLVHVLQNYHSFNILDWLWTFRKFSNFRRNFNNSRDVLVD